MKDITIEEFENAPTLIQIIYIHKVYGLHIGYNTVVKAKQEFSEYFKD